MSAKSILEVLRLQFPGRLGLSPSEAGHAVFGWARKTTANKISQKSFPFVIHELGGSRIVLLTEIARVLDHQKRRGRPPKSLVIQRGGNNGLSEQV